MDNIFDPKSNISDYDMYMLLNMKSLEEQIAYLDKRMETFFYAFEYPPYQELKAKLQKELEDKQDTDLG